MWWLLWFGMAMAAMAGELPQPPPLHDEPVEERRFLKDVYDHHNVLVITTTNPNGNISKLPGTLLLYNNGGSYKLCVNVTTTGRGTTWRCSANAFTAP